MRMFESAVAWPNADVSAAVMSRAMTITVTNGANVRQVKRKISDGKLEFLILPKLVSEILRNTFDLAPRLQQLCQKGSVTRSSRKELGFQCDLTECHNLFLRLQFI